MGVSLAVLGVVAVFAPGLAAALPSPWARLALAVLAAGGVLAAARTGAGPLRGALRKER